MKGAVFLGDQRVEIRDFSDPKPGNGEVLIQMKASALCGSDLWMYRASPAQPPAHTRNIAKGHEPCGVVAALV